MLNLTVKLVKVPTCQITSPAMSCKYCHLIISHFLYAHALRIKKKTRLFQEQQSRITVADALAKHVISSVMGYQLILVPSAFMLMMLHSDCNLFSDTS